MATEQTRLVSLLLYLPAVKLRVCACRYLVRVAGSLARQATPVLRTCLRIGILPQPPGASRAGTSGLLHSRRRPELCLSQESAPPREPRYSLSSPSRSRSPSPFFLVRFLDVLRPPLHSCARPGAPTFSFPSSSCALSFFSLSLSLSSLYLSLLFERHLQRIFPKNLETFKKLSFF